MTLTGNPKSVFAVAVCVCAIGSMLHLLTNYLCPLALWSFCNVNLTSYLRGIPPFRVTVKVVPESF